MEQTEKILIGIVATIALGIGANWLAWMMRVPAILVLLVTGFVAGPVTGLLDVEAVFGELAIPIVSLSVAIILFEGGLNLRVAELSSIGTLLRRLLTLGIAVTWALGATAAALLLNMPVETALLFGAILTVTGPTVIGPMLRQIRPEGQVGSVAKWEGIMSDPIGAVLAVLVFEAGQFEDTSRFAESLAEIAAGLFKTIIIGGSIGAFAAIPLLVIFRRYWLADYLQSPVTLMIALGSFVLSNHFQPESGLLAVTILGVILANGAPGHVRHIVEFKENLSVILISMLFILLSARVRPEVIHQLGWSSLAFVAALILLVRPASVFLCSIGSELSWKEPRLSGVAGARGIVAAAVASVFAVRLGPDGDALVANMLLVVVATVAIYGLTSGPLARKLGLAQANPQGVLIASAHAGARAIAHALKNQKIPVLLVDTNRWDVKQARLEGLRVYHGSILSESTTEDLNLEGLGRFLALTPNDEVNSLAAWHFSDVFGRGEVYQLVPTPTGTSRQETSKQHLRGRPAFHAEATFHNLQGRFARGAVVKATRLTEEFGYDAFLAKYANKVLPLFILSETNKLSVVTADRKPQPKANQIIISLVEAEE